MHNSDRSIFFAISKLSLFNFIFNNASKLDPIIFADLFSSMLKLHISLILISSNHFKFNLSFLKLVGKLINFSK